MWVAPEMSEDTCETPCIYSHDRLKITCEQEGGGGSATTLGHLERHHSHTLLWNAMPPRRCDTSSTSTTTDNSSFMGRVPWSPKSSRSVGEIEEWWEATDHPLGVLPQNWGGNESNCTLSCIVLKATSNDRRHLALCHDEFRGPQSGLCRSGGISKRNYDN
ncbi:uncharacterized protein TNCV_4528911 [Trichonephila clavipes]|nr:uncharacterized protein TNCV_4528911 [Trichonephila clavipes]